MIGGELVKKKVIAIFLVFVFCVSFVSLNENTVLAASNAEIRSKIISLLYGGVGGYMSCDFDGYTTTQGRHEGIDFVSGSGNNVYAIADGTVTAAKTSSSGLTTIAIYNSSYNVTIVYLHTKNFAVSTGTVVSKGTKIAQEGNSGASAVHTHVELRTGSRTSAAVSVNDYTLDNPNPYPYYEKMLFNEPTHTIDESYGHDFSATCTSKHYTLTQNHSEEGKRWIDSGDVCTIHEVYTDGCCYVTYPSGDTTREAYGKISWFSFTNSTPSSEAVNLGDEFMAIIYPSQRGHVEVMGNNNGNAELVEEKGNSNERWRFERAGDGYYYIRSMLDGGYLDVTGANTDDGTNIQVRSWTGSDAQRWYIYEGSYGYQIVPKHCSGSCLDCASGAISYGTNIQLWTKNSTEAQGFYLWKTDNRVDVRSGIYNRCKSAYYHY